MNVDFSFTTGLDGTGYVTLPIPSGTSKCIAAGIDVEDPAALVPPHHDVDVNQTNNDDIRDASGVVAQPCVGAQPAGHQRVRIVGGAPSHFYTGHAIFA